MIYEIILAVVFGLFIGGGAGYFVGRYQATLINKIRTLEEKGREEPVAKAEPIKPTVMSGAYQPPREVSTSVEKKQGAGLVETKTPERLDWENTNELAKLEHS